MLKSLGILRALPGFARHMECSVQFPMSRLYAALVAGAFLVGCNMTGTAELEVSAREGSGSGSEGLDCEAPSPGAAPIRRLSHTEYRYSIEDLLAAPTVAATAAGSLTADPVSLGFSNSATLLDVKPVLGSEYMTAAEGVAESVTADLGTLLPCDPAIDGEVPCVTEFVQSFGRRAYRRPLTAEEVGRYVAGFQTLRAQYDLRTGVEFVVSTFLQSPNFLYRPEPNDGAVGPVRAVTGYELASRLSYLLWHSVPDEELLAAAAEGRLVTREDVEREARRMLEDPRGRRVVNFFEEWLDVDKMGQYARDPDAFPGVASDALPALFKQETRRFVEHVVFEGDRRLETLLAADFTFANAELAAHYELPESPSGTDFIKVALPAGRRGVWMQGGPLTSHDKQYRTSIVNRGLRVRTALLCQNIPAPPDNVDLTLGPIDQNASQADRLAEHRTNPSCAGCHQLLDPVGQIFENVDAVGRLRVTDEGGRPVTTAGELTSTDDVDGPVSGGDALMTRLAQSEQVRQCFATQLFRYTHGREEKIEDACSQNQAYDRFVQSGHDVRELFVGVVLSDDFLFRPVEN